MLNIGWLSNILEIPCLQWDIYIFLKKYIKEK